MNLQTNVDLIYHNQIWSAPAERSGDGALDGFAILCAFASLREINRAENLNGQI
jgi:hypothetical protein